MGTSLCRISKFVREAVYSTLSHQSITMIATIVIIWCESFEYTERPGRPKGGHVLKSWNVGHSWNLCFGEEKKKRKEKRRRKRVHVSWNTYTQMKQIHHKKEHHFLFIVSVSNGPRGLQADVHANIKRVRSNMFRHQKLFVFDDLRIHITSRTHITHWAITHIYRWFRSTKLNEQFLATFCDQRAGFKSYRRIQSILWDGICGA